MMPCVFGPNLSFAAVLSRTVEQIKANRRSAASGATVTGAVSEPMAGTVSVPLPPITIVDFGSGSGNSALPYAALLPDCNFVLLDEKEACIRIGQRRTDDAALTNVKWCVCYRMP